ncbi:MAG: glycosyltransferase, partial [Pseudomonadota bacterium]
ADILADRIALFQGNPTAFEEHAQSAARFARDTHGAFRHEQRVSGLTGRDAELRLPVTRPNRVLFVCSNGLGLGHLTRLLAIARRMDDRIEPVFATMSQAFGVVRSFGIPVEYIPFHGYGECNASDWNRWLSRHLAQIMDFYDVGGVVFDGGAPYAGLIEAVAPRPDTFFVWIRRAMWPSGEQNLPLLARQKFCDLIVEPGDIADSLDHGPTVPHRHRAQQVDPIRLLDEEELLERDQAAAELGLDPKRPALLIQLGSGTNRDVLRTTASIVASCRRHADLQIVLAEWAVAGVRLEMFEGIRLVRGFPLSRYFNAFDMTVSAVGYNSYHELLTFGLPSIFVPNDNPVMDGQKVRAAFAEDQGAAFCLDPGEPADLDGLIDMLMDPRTRMLMKANCHLLARPNGAAQAATLVSQPSLAGSAWRPKSALANEPESDGYLSLVGGA